MGVPAAVREGLLQIAGPAAFVALRQRSWPGDEVLIELLNAASTGADTGRGRLEVDLDMLGEVLGDQLGGYLDLTTGTVWPIELVELGQVEGLAPYEDPATWPQHWTEGRVPPLPGRPRPARHLPGPLASVLHRTPRRPSTCLARRPGLPRSPLTRPSHGAHDQRPIWGQS